MPCVMVPRNSLGDTRLPGTYVQQTPYTAIVLDGGGRLFVPQKKNRVVSQLPVV